MACADYRTRTRASCHCSAEGGDIWPATGGEQKEFRSRGLTFEEYDLPEQGLRTENGIATMRGEKVAWFKDTEGNIFSVGCTCR